MAYKAHTWVEKSGEVKCEILDWYNENSITSAVVTFQHNNIIETSIAAAAAKASVVLID